MGTALPCSQFQGSLTCTCPTGWLYCAAQARYKAWRQLGSFFRKLTYAVAPTGTGSSQSLQGCNEWGHSKETLVTSTFDYTAIETPWSYKLKILYWGKKKDEPMAGWRQELVRKEICNLSDHLAGLNGA